MDRHELQHEPLADDGAAATVARSLAPEEVRIGDYVAVLRTVYEVPTFLWCGDDALSDRSEPVRMQLVPEEGGEPLKVKAVCLPYVLVKSPRGKTSALDVRRHQLARLGRGFARRAWKAFKQGRSKSNG